MTDTSTSSKEKSVKNPIQWLFGACLMLLGCAIALTLTVELLACIWPWVLAITVVIAGVWVAIRWAAARNRKW